MGNVNVARIVELVPVESSISDVYTGVCSTNTAYAGLSCLNNHDACVTRVFIRLLQGEGAGAAAGSRGEFLSRAAAAATAAVLGIASSAGGAGVAPASALVKGNAPPPGYNKKRGSGYGNGEPGERINWWVVFVCNAFCGMHSRHRHCREHSSDYAYNTSRYILLRVR